MSYTVEPVSDVAIVNPSEMPMREERIFDPYRSTKLKAAPEAGAIPQANIDESQSAADSAQPADTVRLSPQMAVLAKKEQKFRLEQQKLKADREALALEKAKVQKALDLQAKLDAKDFSTLDELVDYNAFSEYKVKKLNDSDPVQAKLNQLEQEIQNVKKSGDENLEKQFQAAVEQRKSAASKLIETTPAHSEFKTKIEKIMPKLNLVDAVTKHILDTWEHDSLDLPVDQAVEEVKNGIIENAKMWAGVLDQPTEVSPAAGTEKRPLPPLKQGLKTITNQVTTSDTPPPRKSYSAIRNEQDRWNAAREAVLAKLNKQGA